MYFAIWALRFISAFVPEAYLLPIPLRARRSAVSGLRMPVCGLAALLLLAGCHRGSGEVTDSIAILSDDVDADGRPDFLGKPVIVVGRVAMAAEPEDDEDLFLEQCGRAIRLAGNTDGLTVGDSTRVEAVLGQGDEQLFLEVARHSPLAGQEALERICEAPAKSLALAASTPAGIVPAVLKQLPGGDRLDEIAVILLSIGLFVGIFILMRRWWPRRARPALWEFQAVFHHVPDAMLIADDRLDILMSNPAADQLCAPVRALKGKKISDVFQAEGNQNLSDLLSGDITGVVSAMVKLADTADGEANLTLRASITPIGGKRRLLVTLSDTSDRMDREQVMKRLYQVILQEMPVDVAVLSPHGQYVFASGGVAEDPKLRSALIGKTDVELCQELGLHNEVALRRRAQRRRTVSTGEPVKFDEVLSFPTGERHYVRHYHPVFNQRGEVSMVVSYAMDTTELRKLRSEHASLSEEVGSLRRVKETILQNLSHEFRTPLTGIMGAVQLLQYEVSDDQRELLDIADRNGSRLLKTLNDMLDLADLQADDLQMTLSFVNTVEEMKAVVRGLQAEAESKGLYLRLNASSNEIWSRVDAACFYRAMRHLVDNAIKFTEKGGVLVEMDANDEQVFIHVMDSGVGIDSGYMNRVYEPFNQESSGLARQFEGMGVGLSITERLVSLMQGTIMAQSEKNGGTMFSVIFPRVLVKRGAQEESRPRVLVAERDVDEQRLLRYMLEPFCDVVFVQDVERILDFAGAGQSNAIILNIDAGVEWCEQWLRRIRQQSAARIPIIGIHTHSQPGDRERYLALGLTDYLVRPVDKKDLLNALESLTASVESHR